MGKAAFTAEQIIAEGKKLYAKDKSVTAWKIHEAMGGKGKYSRYEEIWNGYLDTLTKATPSPEIVLPEDIEDEILTFITDVQARMQGTYRRAMSMMRDEQQRHESLMARDHQRALSEKQEEISYFRNLADHQAEEINQLSETISALTAALDRAKAAPSSRVSGNASTGKPCKSPSRPPQKTNPVSEQADQDAGPLRKLS